MTGSDDTNKAKKRKGQAAFKQVVGYHFTGEKLRNGDLIPEIGKWLKHTGEIIVCLSGLHASEHPFDALQYAPGNLLHKVILRGDLQSHGDPIDKWVGRERKILASINSELLLRAFARHCALKVIHLWNAPKIVREYLETGDESKRAAALDAAWAAARDAAWAAARDAALAAARDAARDAALAAARDATWAAAWDAAWDAALDAARAAAWDAAWAANRKQFAVMVSEAFSK